MAQTIKLRRSATQGGTPTVSQLSLGEVAINTYDGKMYIKKDDGSESIVEVGVNSTIAATTLTGNLSMGDNVRARFGTSNDLQIYHDGSNSYINDTSGTGNLYLASNQLIINNSTNSENMARFAEDGAVTLYNNGVAKFATTNTGIDVTGSVVTDGLTSAGTILATSSTTISTILRGGDGNSKNLVFQKTTGSAQQAKISAVGDDLRFTTGTTTERMRIDSLGNASFNTTNISPSANNVIGTALLQYGGASMSRTNSVTLDLNRSSSDGDIVYFRRDGTRIGTMTAASGKLQLIGENQNLGLGSGGVVRINLDNSHFYPGTHNAIDLGFNAAKAFRNLFLSGVVNVAGGIQNTQTTSGFGYLNFGDTDDANIGQIGYDHTSNYMRFQVNNTEKMRIDSSGNLLVGKTTSSSATAGITLEPAGAVVATRDGGECFIGNRKTSDGTIIQLRKDQTSVGSIGSVLGDAYIGSGDTGIRFHDGTDSIFPVTAATGANRGSTVNLGHSTNAFKDLYLSNKVYANYIGSSGDTNTNIYFPGSDQIRFVNGGSESLRIDASGNTIFGGTSVGAAGALSVKVDGTYTDLYLYGAGTSQGGRIFFGDSSDRSSITGTYGTGGGGKLSFKTDTTGGTSQDRLVIDSDGSIRFNNAFTFPTADGSANQLLQTDGSGNVSWATVSGSGTPTYLADADNNTKIQVEESADENKIRFDTAGTQRMLLDNTGKLAVGGNQDPAYPLDLRNPSDSNQIFRVYFPDSSTVQIGTSRMASGNTQGLFVEAQTLIKFGISGAEKMRLTAAGNLGIGTTAAASLLEVSSSSNPEISITSTAGSTDNKLSFRATSHSQPIQTQIKSDDNGNHTADLVYMFKAAGSAGALTEQARLKSNGDFSANGLSIGNAAGNTRSEINNSALYTSYYNTETSPRIQLGRDVGIAGGAGLALGGNSSYALIGTNNTSGTNLYFKAASAVGAVTTDPDMVILSNGNVGIGTTAPSEKLHIHGGGIYTTPVTYAANQDHWALKIGASNNAGWDFAGIKLRVNSVGNPRMSLMGAGQVEAVSIVSGRVGIGTATPNTTLTLSDGTDEFDFGVTTNQLMIKSVTSDASDDQRIIIDAGNGGQSSTRGAFVALSGNEAASEAGKAIYQMGNVTGSAHVFRKAGGVDAVTIDSSGNVGIGNTNPNKPLTITADSGANGMALRARSADDYSFFQFFNNAGTALRGQIYSKAAGDIGFTTGTDSSAGNDFYIKNGGNIGIGTAAPSSLLNIKGADANFIIQDTNTGYTSQIASLTLTGSTASGAARTDVQHKIKLNGDNLTFVNGTNDDERMRIAKSGAVSIGTTTAAGAGGLLVDNDIKTNSRFGVGSGGTLSTAAIYKNSDANTGIYWPANNEIALTTAGAERLRIDSSGLVTVKGSGAGSVSDHFRIESSDTESKLAFVNTTGNGAIVQSGGDMRFMTNTANIERMRITGAGNVGIGTSSPDYTLELVGDSMIGDASAVTSPAFGAQQNIVKSFTYGSTGVGRDGNLYLLNTNTGGDAGFLTFGAYYNNTNNLYYQTGGIGGGKETAAGSGWGGYLSFWTTSDGTAGATSGQFEHMRITADGNVGIGNTAPTNKLDVAGVAGLIGGARLGSVSSGEGIYRQMGTNANGVAITTGSFDSSGIKLFVAHQNDGGGVGIGTTAPATTLHVTNSTTNAEVMRLTTTGDDPDRHMYFQSDHIYGSGNMYWGTGAYVNLFRASSHRFYYGTSNTEAMRVHTNGNVGIGTASPYGKLQIEGNTNSWATAPMLVFSSSATGQAAVRDWAIGPADTNYGYFHISQGASTGASPLATSNVRFTISDTGNVGIGTTSPSSLLTVAGTSDLAWSAATSKLQISRSGAVARLQNYESGSASTNLALQWEGGNVGIGTSTPGAKLEIKDGDLWLNGDASSSNPEIFFIDDSGVGTAGAKIRYGNSDGNVYFDHKWDNAGSGFFFRNRVDGTALNTMALVNGNVGIGTASPDALLDIEHVGQINKDTVEGLLRLTGHSNTENGAGIPSAGVGVEFYNSWSNGTPYSMGRISARGEQSFNGGLQFDVSDNTGPGQNNFTTAMSIDPEGRVGIGTTAPQAKLHVDGTTIFDTATGSQPVYFTRLGNINESLKIHCDDRGAVFESIQDETADTYGNFIFAMDAGVTEPYFDVRKGTGDSASIFRVDGGGNVGIGTTAPAAKLQVEVLGIDTTTTSTTAVTQVAIDSMVAATFRSARYTIQVTNSTDGTYHLTEMLLIHDGTTPSINEFGTIFTGSAAEAAFTADINSGNVRILATPASTDAMTFKVVRHSITV